MYRDGDGMRSIVASALGLVLVGVVGCASAGDREPAAASRVAQELAAATPAPETPPAFDSRAPLFTDQFTAVAAGSYRVDTLGTPFSLTVDDGWWVQPNSSAHTVFTDPASVGPGDRDVVFLRPTGLVDPQQPQAARVAQVGWPLDDIEGWLEELIAGVVTGEPTTAMLGGRSAVRFEVRLDSDAVCGPEPYCVGFITNHSVNGFEFELNHRYVIYWVDQQAAPPVVVILGIPDGRESFEARADSLLETVAFGEPQPHPIQLIDPEPE